MATIHKPFKYVPALHTDVARTIRKEAQRLKALEDEKRRAAAEARSNVTPLTKSKTGLGA